MVELWGKWVWISGVRVAVVFFVGFSFCDRPMAFQLVDLQRMHLAVWEMSMVCVAGVAVICGARSEVVGENWVFSFCASGFAAVEFLR